MRPALGFAVRYCKDARTSGENNIFRETATSFAEFSYLCTRSAIVHSV